MCAVLDVAGHGGVSVHDLVPLTTAADLGPLPLAVALLVALTLVAGDPAVTVSGDGAVTRHGVGQCGWAY